METTKKTAFVKGAAILAAVGLICKFIGVLFRIFAVRIVGEHGMFYYELVYPTYSWLLIISSSGIPTAISRMVAERAAIGNYDGARRVFRRSLLLLLLIGIVTSALMFFGAEWIGTVVLGSDVGAKYSMMALAPALLFVSLMCAYRGYLQGLQRMTGTSVSQLTEQIIKFVSGLLLAYLLFRKYADTPMRYAAGAAGLLIGVTVSEALSLVVMMLFYAGTRGQYKALIVDPNPHEKVFGPMLAIAIPITLGASILPIANVLDSAMITRLLRGIGYSEDFAKLNYTALCTYVRSVINLPATLTIGIAMSIVPAISAARVREDREGVKQLSLLSLKIAMAIGLPCAVGLSVLAGPIIKLLYHSVTPESHAIATRLMHVAAFTVVFISLVQTATGALQGVGKHRLPVWFLLIGGVTKVLVNIICIPVPKINILGAVFSNLACFGVAGVLDTVVLLRVTGAKMNVLDTFIKPAFASAVMGAGAWSAHRLLSRIPVFADGRMAAIATVLAILVAVAIYAVLTLLLGMFTKEELAYIPGGRKLARFARR
ncbi:MAG: polysaccharide biosynthesis protein [Clostridia bacterium]|jgi:stage V sporulation protein B|nr:polysaccharide biosynthesis protein [Clostridia bacterium]MBR3037622.1 polysaccharide biosynthesis protein [Clostridia bacterium]